MFVERIVYSVHTMVSYLASYFHILYDGSIGSGCKSSNSVGGGYFSGKMRCLNETGNIVCDPNHLRPYFFFKKLQVTVLPPGCQGSLKTPIQLSLCTEKLESMLQFVSNAFFLNILIFLNKLFKCNK